MNILELLHKCQNGKVSCRRAERIIEEYIEKCVKEKDIGDNMVVIPKDPPTGLLFSMATRQNHAFGLPCDLTDDEILKYRSSADFAVSLMATQYLTSKEKIAALVEMRQLHEEVVGKGFYKYEKK